MKRHHSRRGMAAGRVCAAVRPTHTQAGTQITGRQLPVGIVLVYTDTPRARRCFKSYCWKNGITADVIDVITPFSTDEMPLKDMVEKGLVARAYYEVAGAPDSLAKLINCWFVASQGGSCENDRMTPVLSVGAPRPARPNDFIKKPYPSVFVQTLRETPAFKDDDQAMKVQPGTTYRSNIVPHTQKPSDPVAPKAEPCPFPALEQVKLEKLGQPDVDAFIGK
jgi:hypothetical protein